jgi:type I restriction enzyme S subunit
MSKWKEILLGEVIEVVNGYAFKSTDFLENKIDNSLPVIKIKNVANGDVHLNGCQFHKYEQKLERFVVESGDVLLALTGNHPEVMTQVVGEASRYKLSEKAFLNQRVAKVLPKNARELNTDFLYYFLKDDNTHDYLASQSTGSANQANISKVDIESIPLNLPPLPEQTAIAEVLSSLDDKIDLLHRQNKTLEQLAETLFRQWFVEEAEESWEVGTLGEVITIYDSKRIPLSSGEREKMKVGKLYPYYGAASIMDYVNDYIFDGEYILMGEDGTVQTPDGYPILQLPTGKFWVNNHSHIFQAKPPFTNFFIYTFLKQTNVSGIVTGAVQPKINQEALKGIDFPIPPIEKTKEFITVTNEFWTKIKSNTRQIRTLTQLRDTLLPKLMSGEIRLNRI